MTYLPSRTSPAVISYFSHLTAFLGWLCLPERAPFTPRGSLAAATLAHRRLV